MTSRKFLRRAQLMYDLAFTFVFSLTATALSQVVRHGLNKTGFAWLCVAVLCVALGILPPVRLRSPLRRMSKGAARQYPDDHARSGEVGDESMVNTADLSRLRNALDSLSDSEWQEVEHTCSGSNLSLIRRYIRFRRRSAAIRSLQSLALYPSRESAVSDAVSLLLAPVIRAQSVQRTAKSARSKGKYALAFTAVAARAAASAFVCRDLLSAGEFRELYIEFADAVQQESRLQINSAA